MSETTSEELLASRLNEAVAILSSEDLLTKDSIPVIREALEKVDDLHARLGNYHSRLFPQDARRRLEVIRTGLRFPDIGNIREAFRDLRALAEEVRKAGGEGDDRDPRVGTAG